MKRKVILVVVVVALVAGSLIASNILLAKNSFNGLGKVLVHGSPIDGANGIMFDDADMLYIASGWRPRPLFRWSEVRSVMGFGANLTGSSLVSNIARNADNFISVPF